MAHSLQLEQRKIDERIRAVIPPAVSAFMKRGQYPIPLNLEFLFDPGRYPIVYNCKDVGLGGIAIQNWRALAQTHSVKDTVLKLHQFHSQIANLAPPDHLDRIKVPPFGILNHDSP